MRAVYLATFALAFVMVSCGEKKCPEESSATPSASASTAVMTNNDAAPRQLRVEARCLKGSDYLTVYVPIKPSLATGGADAARRLWSFTCNRRTKSCNAATVDIDAFESGEVTTDALRPLEGATIASDSATITVIRWGLYWTFTVDTTAHRVSYAYSAGNGEEARGEAHCPGAMR